MIRSLLASIRLPNNLRQFSGISFTIVFKVLVMVVIGNCTFTAITILGNSTRLHFDFDFFTKRNLVLFLQLRDGVARTSPVDKCNFAVPE